MATNLRSVPHLRLNDYGYPVAQTVLVEVVQGDGYEIHEIYYHGAPGSDFDNAPNGSKLFDLTNRRRYVKIGQLGLSDGDWDDLRGISDGMIEALAGTVGTPSSSNRYVTDADTRIRSALNVPTSICLPVEGFGGVVSPSYTAAVLQTGTAPALCRIFGRRVFIDRSLPNASKLCIYVVSVAGSGSLNMKFALYSSDGTTKIAEWPWGAVSAGAVLTLTLAAPVDIRTGEYLLVYSGVVWNTLSCVIRSHQMDLNSWGPQMTAVAGKLHLFRSANTISVADVTDPVETMPSDLGILSYNVSSFDETMPFAVIYSA